MAALRIQFSLHSATLVALVPVVVVIIFNVEIDFRFGSLYILFMLFSLCAGQILFEISEI